MVLLCGTLLSSCGRAPVRYEAEYLLADHLDSAVAVRRVSHPLAAPHLAIGHDERRVVLQHPPSAYRFAGVPSGPGRRFLAAPTLNPKAWEKPTDGVVFEVLCRGLDDELTQLLSLAISPASKAADRVWHDREIELDRCSVPTTELELRTSCGENCIADWAGWGDPRVIHPQVLEPRFRRLVLLISIDTLRPDRLGLYGAARNTSPELDRLARDSIVFETAIASSPWTIPSHATMLTATYPQAHGANAQTPIPSSVTRLAEALTTAGWQTAGFVDTPYLGHKFGFDQGFEHYDDDAPPRGDFRRGARVLRQRALDWLARTDERPAFVFWHIMDVHGPYWAPAPFGGRFRDRLAPPSSPDPRLEQLRRLEYHDYLRLDRFASFDDLVAAYDEGIAATDAAIGGLLQCLRDAGLYEDAVIVVTSDHGESFLDHGVWVGHGLFLTDDEIRVPLIVKLPRNRHAGTRVEDVVGLIDLAPSILEVVGAQKPASFQGRSFLSAAGEPTSPREAIQGSSGNTGAAFLRTSRIKYIAPATISRRKLVDDVLKMQADVSLPLDVLVEEQIYDLRRDPAELDPASGTSEILTTLRALVEAHAAASKARLAGSAPDEASSPDLSPEVKERLRALGYAQ